MRNKEVDVIKSLLQNKEKELSINQLALLLKKDYKNTHNIVMRLSKIKVIDIQPLGKSHRVILINKIHPLIFEAEHLRREELLKNKNLSILFDSFKGLKSKFFVLLVFGSYAKKTQTKHSDIDLLFIVPDSEEEKAEKEIENIAGTLPIKIHTNIFRETDFKAMKNSKEITIGSQAMNNNIILYGIEQYYELIS